MRKLLTLKNFWISGRWLAHLNFIDSGAASPCWKKRWSHVLHKHYNLNLNMYLIYKTNITGFLAVNKYHSLLFWELSFIQFCPNNIMINLDKIYTNLKNWQNSDLKNCLI